MLKKISYPFLFIIIASIFSACKKYPEGPCFSLRSKEARVVGGYRIESYLIDGKDSTQSKYPSSCHISFNVTGKGLTSHSVSSSCDMIGGFWEFGSGKNSIIVHSSSTNNGAFFLDSYVEWEIVELRNKHLHLKTKFNSKFYEFYLNQI